MLDDVHLHRYNIFTQISLFRSRSLGGCVIVEVLSINSSIYKMIYGMFISFALPVALDFPVAKHMSGSHTHTEGKTEREKEREEKRDTISHHLFCCCFVSDCSSPSFLAFFVFLALFCLPRLRNLIFGRRVAKLLCCLIPCQWDSQCGMLDHYTRLKLFRNV